MAKIKAVRTRQRGKTFSYAFEAGRDENGKRIVIEKGGFATRSEAYERGTEAFVDFKHGNIGITSEKITVRAYMESWLKSVAKINIKKSTYISYGGLVKNRINPYIGGVILQELTPGHIDNMLRKQVLDGASYSTVAHVKTLLSSALKYAVYPAQLISSNPCLYVKVSKNAKKNCVTRTIITPEKLQEILSSQEKKTCYRLPALIMYHTGMRVNEVLGLTWDRIDLHNGTITVDRQIVAVSRELTSPKTSSSIRTIPIDAKLIAILKVWKAEQAYLSEKPGYVYIYEGPHGSLIEYSKDFNMQLPRVDIVTTHPNGKRVKYDGLKKFLKRYGVNAHSFRHTHATVLIENGATPKGVADRLGHTSTEITQNLYTHVTDKLKNDTLNIFINSQNADK